MPLSIRSSAAPLCICARPLILRARAQAQEIVWRQCPLATPLWPAGVARRMLLVRRDHHVRHASCETVDRVAQARRSSSWELQLLIASPMVHAPRQPANVNTALANAVERGASLSLQSAVTGSLSAKIQPPLTAFAKRSASDRIHR